MRILSLALLCACLPAAPPPPKQATVRIPVWSDRAEPLKAEDLTAMANDQPAKVVRLQQPSDDLLLVLILDLVANLNEIDLAREGLANTIAELPANVYVGLMRAQDGLQVLLDPTDDRDAVIKSIQSLTVSGTPGLLETIETATELADSVLAKSPVRIAICYITDSDIRDYREDFTNPVVNYSDRRDLSRRFPEGLVRERISKLAIKLSSRQTPVFVVHLEYFSDQLNEAYQSGLMQLTANSGGESIFCRSNSEIQPAIETMLRRISSHYGADLRVTASAGENVDIVLKAPGANLTYRPRIHLKKRGD